MSATEVVYVRVRPETKRRLDALVEAGKHSWPRLTVQSIVAGFIETGLDRIEEANAAESAAKPGRVVRGPQLKLPAKKVSGAQARAAAKHVRKAGAR